MQKILATVAKEQHGLRVDIFLAGFLKDISRRKLRLIIDRGGVYKNGKRLRVASRTVAVNDRFEIIYDENNLNRTEKLKVELEPGSIIFENEDFLALNKPPGLASQATKDQSIDHVIPALRRLRQIKDLVLVHRLDKETSGVILLAKSNRIATIFTEFFKEHRMQKTYECVVSGRVTEKTFTIKNYLSEIDKKTGLVHSVKSGGKSAETSFEVISVSKDKKTTWLRCFPKTGRSHQIRVHLAEFGFPIVADKKYNISKENHLKDLQPTHHLLHARELQLPESFFKPKILAEYPPQFAVFLKNFT